MDATMIWDFHLEKFIMRKKATHIFLVKQVLKITSFWVV